ncbi:MAG: MBL fold metallo-hydrolase [Povalibacter sp.]
MNAALDTSSSFVLFFKAGQLMRTLPKFCCLSMLCFALAATAAEDQHSSSAVTKLSAPTIFPNPGTYFNTTALALRHEVPDAQIHYTWDGSEPTASSATFDPRSVLFIQGLYEANKGLKTGYTLRAVAMKPGMEPSDPATFAYTIERRDRTAYVSEEVRPGVRMIRDSDNDKMFLIRGSARYALIDSGMGRGALREYVAQFTGGLPLVTIWTHSHGDHIGQADQFIADSIEYVGEGDRDAVAEFLRGHGASAQQIDQHLKSVSDGSKIDLGDHALEIVSVPGHTPGSIVILDSASGNLFTGDSVGNNSPLPPDVLWMQRSTEPLDMYLAAVRTARSMIGTRIRFILTGHNDRPLVGTTYLDNLETALQRAMDEGAVALVPSYRPPGLQQIVVGDRLSDPNWFGININPQSFLPAPTDQIASLTLIEVTGATLTNRFTPNEHDYHAKVSSRGTVSIKVLPASSRVRTVAIDGKAVKAGASAKISFKGEAKTVPVVVTALDGKSVQTYRVTLEPA